MHTQSKLNELVCEAVKVCTEYQRSAVDRKERNC